MQGGGKKIFDFFFVGGQRQAVGNIKPLYISKKLLPLYMDYELEIHNRIKIGFAIGHGISKLGSFHKILPSSDES